MTRILFYSHDTFGLGHIRRTQKLANTIANSETSILIACASPKASSYSSREGIEYLNLPGFAKLPDGTYKPENLNISMEEFVSLRANILLSTVQFFKPDFLIIDKEPLGVKKELLLALDYLKSSGSQCKIICGFRDILDAPASIAEEFRKKDTINALDKYFDTIFVYGDKDIFDFCKQYDLPANICKKIKYTGYLSQIDSLNYDEYINEFSDKELPLITFTTGGGGDGEEFLDIALDALEQNKDQNRYNIQLLTGPFIARSVLARANQIAKLNKQVRVLEFTTSTTSLFSSSALVVSMGGYNTMTELASLQKFPLIIPRVTPRVEQLLRVEAFKESGLCDYIHPDNLTPHSLFEKIHSILDDGAPQLNFKAEGLENVRSMIKVMQNELH